MLSNTESEKELLKEQMKEKDGEIEKLRTSLFFKKYGDLLGFDVYQQTLPDKLHQFDRGVCEWLFTFLYYWIEDNFEARIANSLIEEIDQRLGNCENY